jgi:hypothetical protein
MICCPRPGISRVCGWATIHDRGTAEGLATPPSVVPSRQEVIPSHPGIRLGCRPSHGDGGRPRGAQPNASKPPSASQAEPAREEPSLSGIGPCWVAVDRRAADNSGQERTQDVGCNRRSLDLQLPDLRRGRQARWSSSLPTQLPRALRALARVAVSHRGRASLSGRARNPRRHVRTIVILAGVPPTCHKQRSPAVSSGQSRSLRDGRCAGRWPLTWTVGSDWQWC